MKKEDLRIYKLAWIFLHGIGPQRARQLLAVLQQPEELFTLDVKMLAQMTGIPLKILYKMQTSRALDKARKCAEDLDKYQVKMAFIQDADYPKRLKQCVDAPLVLFYKGRHQFHGMHMVSLVGMRSCSSYGRKVVEELVEACVGQNVVVVSGLAYGIDICAHRHCLAKGVPTLSVFGHGFDVMYPKEHMGDARRILEHGGAWISEFPPGTKLDPGNFPMRNRIVAGLSDVVVVVESKLKGGSLITAELALDYNREVLAVPGPINQEKSAGCNRLIAGSKAQLYSQPADLFQWMGWNQSQAPQTLFTDPKETIDLPESERKMLELLSEEGPLHMDVLAAKSAQSVAHSSVMLFLLETKGYVRAMPGNMFGVVQ